MTPIGVLIVDDSAFARRVFREVLGQAPDIAVLGSARDGLEALEEIARRSPDVITLDLMMPNLDGLGLLRQLSPALRRRVVIVSISPRESEPAVKALQLGAFDVVTKPTAMATDQLHEIGFGLVEAVRRCAAAAAARARPPASPRVRAPPPRRPRDLVVIGASTGGPAAITRVVPALPADFAAPVVIALHIPAGYTRAFAERLDQISPLRVREARDGEAVSPGLVLVVPGGCHASVERAGARLVCRVGAPDESAPFAPSVDRLFESAASAAGPGVLAVVLTGMGDDGLVGSRAVVARGGEVLTESWSSAVVYGMPRAVAEAGLSAATLPIERVAPALVERTRSGGAAARGESHP